MADTKKSGGSIVWSWREVTVENCTCMSVQAGMYCGPERTPGIANDSPVESSCGHHCWDLGYVDAETGDFISKGFPMCGGLEPPPLPDPILWPEFPSLDNLNTDEVPPCQQRATRLAFKRMAGLRAEFNDDLLAQVESCATVHTAEVAAAEAAYKTCKDITDKRLRDNCEDCKLKDPDCGSCTAFTETLELSVSSSDCGCCKSAKEVYKTQMYGCSDIPACYELNYVRDGAAYKASCIGIKREAVFAADLKRSACQARQSTTPMY